MKGRRGRKIRDVSYVLRLIDGCRGAIDDAGDLDVTKAAELAGVDRRTISRAWWTGIAAERAPECPPIRLVVNGASKYPPDPVSDPEPAPEPSPPPAHRALRPELVVQPAPPAPAAAPPPVLAAPAPLPDLHELAARIQGKENQVAAAAREAAHGSAALVTQVLSGLQPLVTLTAANLREQAERGMVSPTEVIRMLSELVKLTERLSSSLSQLVPTQRAIVGASQSVSTVIHQSDGRRESVPSGIEATIARAAGILDRQRAQDARRAAIAREMADSNGYQGIEGP